MTDFVVNPSSYDSDYAAYSATNISNGYSNDSSTSYGQIGLTRGSNAVTYFYYKFDTSTLPESIQINSVTCKCKCIISNANSSYTQTREIQMFSGITAKGSAYTLSTSTTAFDITCGTWKRNELNDVRIRLYGQRGTSSTSSNIYFRFYGATLTISYTVAPSYNITASSNVSGVSIEPVSGSAIQGDDYELIIDADDLTGLVLTDNNTDVTSSVVSGASSSTTEKYPYACYVNGTVTASGSHTPYDIVGHGIGSPVNQTNSEYWTIKTGAKIAYFFVFATIPKDATITNVIVSIYGMSWYGLLATLYSGTTQKGSSELISGSSMHKTTISDAGTWTWADLQNANIIFGDGDSDEAYIGGITWVVSYTVGEYKYTIQNVQAAHTVVLDKPYKIYVKVNDAWKDASNIYAKISGAWQPLSSVYKKVSGDWVNQNNLSKAFDPNAIYNTGSHYNMVPVEYLESTGTQYIDTGIVPDADTGILVKAMSSNSTDTYLAGLREDGNNTRWCIGHSGSNTQYYYGYGNWATGGSSYTSMSVIARLNYNNINKFAISEFNGSSQMNVALPTLPFTPARSIYIFGANYYAESGVARWSGRIYSAQITQDNVIVRDFIPVSVNSVGYLYDKVSGQLFGNGGTGSFAIGAYSTQSPRPYDAEIAYIKSSGTQYISTGYAPTATTHIIMRAAYKGMNYYDSMNGSMKSSSGTRFYWGVMRAIVTSTMTFRLTYHFATGKKYTNTIEDFDENLHCFELWGNGQFKIDSRVSCVGNSTSDSDASVGTTDKPITLFARNDSSSVGEYIDGMELYTFQIYENYQLKMDFIPVRVGTTGYLYDKIGGQLYGNSGTGSFILGEDIAL